MDLLTEAQLLALVICAILSVVAYKCRMPSLALIPGIGFLYLGYQIFEASDDAFLLLLFIIVAVSQFVLCFGSDGRR